ncbi:hypothetical protein HPB50_025878 [Hyalomma asiaticum]|uniref:Uncharacterized protein n=1 Tax=Hyalomma asiaticum TaxID=266040 RepID=A0ACB7T980_HYAAI|nr:hypothetical protein HPB50_025878 [Hyalomma asiaticum]
MLLFLIKHHHCQPPLERHEPRHATKKEYRRRMRRLTWLLFSLLCRAQKQPPPPRTASFDPQPQLQPPPPPELPTPIPRPDFCKPPYNESHVMCATEPYQSCVTYYTNTSFMNDRILWMHNHYRSHVALGRLADFPSAANMLKMRWDAELANVAEAKGRLCATEIGTVHVFTDPLFGTDDFPQVGYNAYAHWSSQRTMPMIWHVVGRNWFDQNVAVPPQQIAEYVDAPGTEEFAQMVAAQAYALGCSYTRNYMPGMKEKPVLFLYICFYGPKSPVPGKPVYEPGPFCSLCPDDTACDVDTGLCVMKGEKPGPTKRPPDRTVETPPKPKKDGVGSYDSDLADDSAPEAFAVAVMLLVVAATVAAYRWSQVA